MYSDTHSKIPEAHTSVVLSFPPIIYLRFTEHNGTSYTTTTEPSYRTGFNLCYYQIIITSNLNSHSKGTSIIPSIDLSAHHTYQPNLSNTFHVQVYFKKSCTTLVGIDSS